jgi:hypothetical protein
MEISLGMTGSPGIILPMVTKGYQCWGWFYLQQRWS